MHTHAYAQCICIHTHMHNPVASVDDPIKQFTTSQQLLCVCV